MKKEFQKRFYRCSIAPEGLVSFTVTEKESDLFILCSRDLRNEATRALHDARDIIETYIASNPGFLTSLAPLPFDEAASPLIREMLSASIRAGVGPMAAVAGAVAEHVGTCLLKQASEVIVENGGDIYMASTHPRIAGVFTDNPDFRDRIKIRLGVNLFPLGLCTSSGIIGPSLSFGKADAVTVLSKSAALADAAATAIGNMTKAEQDVEQVLQKGAGIEGVDGLLVIIGKKLGVWGEVSLA